MEFDSGQPVMVTNTKKIYSPTHKRWFDEPPDETVEEETPVKPLVNFKELYETDKAWSDWSTQYSMTGEFPDAPEDEALIPYFEQWKETVEKFKLEQPPVEPVEPIKTGVPQVDVTDIAKQYGIIPSYFVKPGQLADLARPPEERLVEWRIPYEQYLTAEQAWYLGFSKTDVPKGSVVKMTPMAEGEPSFSLVEAPQVKVKANEDLVNRLRSAYPLMFDPAHSYGYSPDKIPDMVIDQLQRRMTDDYKGFIDDLFTRVGKTEGEDILRLMGVTEEGILQTLDFTEQEIRLKTAISAVFPDFKSIDEFNELLKKDLPLFIETMQTGGSSTEKRRLLEYIGFKPERINQIFSVQRLVLPVDGVRKLLTIDVADQRAYDDLGKWVGNYNLDTKQFTPLSEQKLLQPSVYERLGYTPPPPVTSPAERQERAKAFQTYRKAGGKLLADQWELYGMPATPKDEPRIPTPEERQAIIDEEVVKHTNLLKVFGEGLTKLPQQMGASILSAIQGQGGASVVDKDWADLFIEDARTDLDAFAKKVTDKYGDTGLPIKVSDIAYLPQNMAYSLTSMGVGLAAGIPIGLAPVPGARAAAWFAGSAASGAVAYSMTTYQITQEYLELKNQESIQKTGKGITAEEEKKLKEGFEAKAREYGLWEALPEAVSNLAFAKILTTPLTKVVGKSIASKLLGKLFSLYGEELLTETITQKGQSAIEVQAGLREGNIDWVEAFKEVAPQTFLLTTVLGGLGQTGISTIRRIKTSLTNEIGADNPLHSVIQNKLDNAQGSLGGIVEGASEYKNWYERVGLTPEATARIKAMEVKPGEIGLTAEGKAVPPKVAVTAPEVTAPIPTTPEVKGARTYWDTNLENNPLRVGNKDTDAGAFLAVKIENAGDILREYAGNKDQAYMREKFDKLSRELTSRDWTDQLSVGEVSRLTETNALLEELPIPDETTKVIKDLITSVTTRNTKAIKANLNKLEPLIFPKLPTAEVGMPEAGRRIPSAVGQVGITQEQQNEYTKRMTPFLNKADAEIKKVNDAFMTGKTSLAENQAQRDAINAELDKQANKTRTEMGFPEAITPPAEVAPSPLLTVLEETTLPMPDNVTVSEDRVVRSPPPPEVPPPHEPSPTHPPQPAPIENNRLVMPDLQPAQQVVDVYSRPDFWRNVANLPLVKKAVGLFNPAAVANDPARQAIILRATLKDEGAQKAQAVMAHLWEIGTQDRVWGKTDEMGLLKSEPFTGISIDDIRTNPAKYSAQMTAQQREWIKRADEIERAKLDALKRNEIEINELSFEDGGVYAGRRVMGKFNDSGELIESGRIGIGGRVGAKMPFEKTRIFKDASDGINAGYRYMNSDEALYYNTLGAYNKIADKQMAEWVLSKVDWRTTKAPEALVLEAESARIRLRKAQQLLGALNRAVRGERVPSNTINSIASVYVDQADTLRTLIPELQKPFPETADTVRILDAEAKTLISQAKLEYYQAVNERARAREEAQRVKYEEASIAHPAFQGKIFTGEEAKEIADILTKGLQPQFIEALGAVNKVNAIGRFFMLAGDASPMAIQLQFLSFYRPVAYAKAWGGFVRAMFDPEFQYRYYANNRDLINRHPTLILSGRGTEFTEFMGRGGLGKKLGVLVKPLVSFQKAFEGCIDVAGIELAKSLDHRCINPQTTMEVDQFINEFRGMTSSARIGVSSTQRQVETAAFLAPRYNRAIAGYLFDIVHGGVRGSLARMSLAQGFAGIAAMAVAVSIALGEDDDEIWQHFDPTSNKFFTWDVMGVKIGPGGKVRSIIKVFGNMLRTGDVGKPALDFLRGNLSPGASTALDLITGKNYIGEPTRDNVLDFTKTVGRNFMMLWTQNFLLEGGTLKEKALIATAEFFGLRGYDISAKKELKIKDLEEMLGTVIGKTPVLSKKKPDIYQGNNIYSGIKKLLETSTPEEVLADKGYAGLGHIVVKMEQSEGNTLPDIRLQDYNFDKTKGDIISDYMSQWAERQRIIDAGERAKYTRVRIVEGKEERTEFKGLAALNAHKQDYPNAERGNLTRRQRELLLGYNAATDKKQFIKDNPDISINPKTEWLKAHPKENAEFAMFGQASILTKEAYNIFKGLLKEWDWPDAAIPEMTLPPETSISTHFAYEEMVSKGTHTSVEADLLLLKDHLAAIDAAEKLVGRKLTDAEEAKVVDYAKWADLKLSDKSLEYLQMRVDNSELYAKMKAIKEDDTLDDKIKDKDGLTAKDRAYAEVRATKVGTETFHDIERRVDAMNQGTRTTPIAPEIVDAYVGHMQIVDTTSGLSAEAKLNRYDNPALNDFLMNEDYWGKQKAESLDEDKAYLDNYLVPRWRIEVNPDYKKKDIEYKAIKDPNEAEQDRLRAEWLAQPENAQYRTDKRKKEAYELSNPDTGVRLPVALVDTYVAFNEIPQKGKRQERFVVDNPAFAKAMFDINGKDIYKTRPEDVPSVEYDNIYDQNKQNFDLIDSFKDANDKTNYKDNTVKDPVTGRTAREQAVYDLRFDGSGKYNEFGLAEIRRNGYEKFVPEQHIQSYVGYYKIIGEGKPKNWKLNTGTDLWYDDDWYMWEHKDFYQEVYMNPKYWDKPHEKWDFIKVPTREVFNKYLEYLAIDSRLGKAREDYRAHNKDLDAWGVIAFDWVPISEKKRKEALTPYEKFIEGWTTKGGEIEEKLAKLRE